VNRGEANGVNRADVPGGTSLVGNVAFLARHGGVVEGRILQTPRGTVSGYFDDYEALARAVKRWDRRFSIYVTLNPVKPDLLARAKNRLKDHVRTTTSDTDIVRRAWFPIDLDAKRPTGVSSTDQELESALKRRGEVLAFLHEIGFPDGVEGMSGNGGHLLYPVDLPNDDASGRLIEMGLKALHSRFSDDRVVIDQAVFNAARIWKLYGTMAVKGDSTDDRPHRRAVLERVPDHLKQVDLEVLKSLAATAPTPKTWSLPSATGQQPSHERLDLLEVFRARGLYLKDLGDGKHAVTCPWAPEHSGTSGVTETALFELREPGRPWGFDCKHAHCADRTIRDVLAHFGLRGRIEGTTQASAPTTTDAPSWPLYDVAVDWDFPSIEWVIDQLLPARSLVWIGGLPKRYKSLLMLYFCLAIACRRPTVAGSSLSRFKILTRPRILYIAREDGGARIKERCVDIMAAWGSGHPVGGALRVVIRPHMDLLSPAHIAWLREVCRRENIKLLILDTWTALSPTADPMSAEAQARLAAVVTQLREDIDGTVAVVDHSRKNQPDANQPLSSADIYGPHQKWAAAEHIIMIRVVDERQRRIEVFVEGKDGDTQRFFLTVSARGSAIEKFSWAGTPDEIAQAKRLEGDKNRELIFRALGDLSGSWVGVAKIVSHIGGEYGRALARTTVKNHLGDLVAQRLVDRTGRGRNTKYMASARSGPGPSGPNHRDEQQSLYNAE
jgi:AAA domain-containing protein